MMTIQSKLPNVGTTIFTEMSVLAQQHQAINLGQGFPDFPMNTQLVELVNQAMQNGQNQYVHMNGLPALREALANKYNRLYGSTISAEDNITITPGATYAIYTAISAIVQPGDEVIVFEPAYDSYIPNIEINGGKAITIQLKHPTYSIDWEQVRAAITPRTKMIMLNTPHNPTGAVLHPDDWQQLTNIVDNKDIFILSDEVYEHLIFDNIEHQSILRYPELWHRAIVTFSFGKTYHCTGWKLGYVIAAMDTMKEIRKVHQFNAFTCDTPKQIGIANYLQKSDDYVHLGKEMQQRRDFFSAAMANTKFTALPSYGSYFQLYDYSAISHLPEKEFAYWLTVQHGVTTIPISAFYKNGCENKVVRFCFAKSEKMLTDAAQRLGNI
jgi:methionine aminotransferase